MRILYMLQLHMLVLLTDGDNTAGRRAFARNNFRILKSKDANETVPVYYARLRWNTGKVFSGRAYIQIQHIELVSINDGV